MVPPVRLGPVQPVPTGDDATVRFAEQVEQVMASLGRTGEVLV